MLLKLKLQHKFIFIFFVLFVVNTIYPRCILDLNTSQYNLEIAATPQERAVGLMNRPYLPFNEGMIFIFPEEGVYSFWMLNTFVALDILWLDKDFYLVDYLSNARPLSIHSLKPSTPANYVIELNRHSQDWSLFINQQLQVSCSSKI